jgi:cobaltochelatase CobT
MGGGQEADVSFHSGNMPLAPLSLGDKVRLQKPLALG